MPDRLFTILSAASLVAWLASAVVVALVAADVILIYEPWPLPVSLTRVLYAFAFGLPLPALWVANLIWLRAAARRHRPGGFPVVVTESTPASPPAPAGSSRSAPADTGS